VGFDDYALVGLVIFKEGQARALRAVRKVGERVRKRLGLPKEAPAKGERDRRSYLMPTVPEDIVAVVGKRIELTKRGSRYAARCPFHPDTVPSLFVSPESQTFFCFGCRAEGTATEFLRLWEALP
jgi:CHC2 zinc finger